MRITVLARNYDKRIILVLKVHSQAGIIFRKK